MNNATYPRSKETAAREEKRIHRAILGLRTNFGSPWERYFRVFHDTLNTVGLWFSSTLTRNTEVQRSGLFKPRLWFLDTYSFIPDCSLTFCFPRPLSYTLYCIPFNICSNFIYSHVSLRVHYCASFWDLPFHGMCLVPSSWPYISPYCLFNFPPT